MFSASEHLGGGVLLPNQARYQLRYIPALCVLLIIADFSLAVKGRVEKSLALPLENPLPASAVASFFVEALPFVHILPFS